MIRIPEPMQIRDFRLYWFARFCAVLATMGMVVIIGYQVYDVARTDYGMSIRQASLVLGLLGAAQFLPLALLTPVAGWVADREKDPTLKVDAIHDERGYREIRRSLARQYDISWQEPDIQIVDVDLAGDRKLMLEHYVTNGVLLADKDAERVVQHLADLWGYEVCLKEVENESRSALKEHKARPRANGPRLAET